MSPIGFQLLVLQSLQQGSRVPTDLSPCREQRSLGRGSHLGRSFLLEFWTAHLVQLSLCEHCLRTRYASDSTDYDFTHDRISQHQYSAAFCQGGDFPLVSFMSKAAVRGNLTIFEADIAATHEQGLQYILGYVFFDTPACTN